MGCRGRGQGTNQFELKLDTDRLLQLGHGHDRDRATPLTISSMRGKRVIRVACGENHTLILTGEFLSLFFIVVY